MPYIALPEEKLLPNLPGPVLDRERRPTVDNSAVIQGVGNLAKAGEMPELPMELANNSGLVAIGKALAQTGDMMGAMAVKRQEAITDRQVADADNALGAETLEFLEYQKNNPDPVGWTDYRKQRLEQLKVQLLADEKLTPQAKERLGTLLTKRVTNELIDTQLQADRKIFAQARDSYAGNIENAIQAGDEPRVRELFAEAKSKGYAYDFEEEAGLRKFEQVRKQREREAKAEAYDTAENGVVSYAATYGADAALKAIDAGQIGVGADDVGKERLRETAKRVSQARATETAEDISDMWEKGELNSPEKVDAFLEDNPHFSESGRAYLKGKLVQRANEEAEAARREDQQMNGAENATRIRHQILALDPTKDGDRRQMLEMLTEISDRVPAPMRAPLREELRRRYSPETAPEISDQISKTIGVFFDPKDGVIPYRKKEFTTVKHTQDEGRWFGEDRYRKGDPIVDPETGEPKIVTDRTGNQRFTWVTDREAELKAIRAEAIVRKKMEQWRLANPDKANNPIEIQKAIKAALPEGTRYDALEAFRRKVKPPESAANSFKARATGYFPVDPGHPEYQMEGGKVGAAVWHGKAVKQEPLYTLEDYRDGKAPYVSVAMDNSEKNPLAYGTILKSPQFPGVPFRVMDTGSAFNGKTTKYGPAKGTSRIDIARRDRTGANSPENNRNVDFEVWEDWTPEQQIAKR